jgi:hypothetical protein
MKRLTTQILFAAAALTAIAVNAPAQMLKAEVPFTFHAGQAVMTPGPYNLTLNTSSHNAILRNVDTGQSVFVIFGAEATPLKAWRSDGRARMGFDCVGRRCVLRQLWPGNDSRSFEIPGPKLGRDEAVRTAEITLTKVNVN